MSMKKFMYGTIEFYHENEINRIDRLSFKGDPNEVKNGERRLRMKIDGEMIYILLKGEYVRYSAVRIIMMYREMLKKYEQRIRIEEVSRHFYIMDNNSAKAIAEATGYSWQQCAWVIREALLSKEEIYP